jgi:hypothetical protein
MVAYAIFAKDSTMKIKEEAALKRVRKEPKIGPSDSSDTISDRPGELDSDTDAEFTGERVTAGIDPHAELHEAEYGPDRVVGPDEAGLGGGLDEAEEAQSGVKDEELNDSEPENEEDEESDLAKAPPPKRK